MEKQTPPAKSLHRRMRVKAGEREPTPRRVEAGFEHFADLFRPPEGVVEHIPEAEVRDKLQIFQREFARFLIDQVGESFGRASEQAQTGLGTLAEILSGLPKGIVKFERTKDKKRASITIEKPTNLARLDIDLGEGKRAQRIRLGLRDAEDNETLVLDVHYYPPRNSLQMELKGKGLGKGTLRHENFPAECSDQETFTQLQLLLTFNLCPTEGKDDKTTAYYLTTKETYLKQLLKELGMKGKVAAKDKKREKIIAKIMAQCPGTPGYQKAQEQQQREREGEKEKSRRKRRIEKEGQEQLEIIAKCADKLEQVIARTPSLTGWLAQQREKWELPPGITNGRIVLGFILDMHPGELDEEARGCELSDGEKILISDIPDLTAQTIQKKHDFKGSAEDALQYMRDLAEAMRDYEE